MIDNEDALAFLMLNGRSEAKARRLLSSPAGYALKEQIDTFIKRVREMKEDPTFDVLEYYRSQQLAGKSKSGRKNR